MSNKATFIFSKIGSGVAAFGKGVATEFTKIKAIWGLVSDLSPQLAHDALIIFADLTAAVADAESAASQDGLNFQLDAKIYADIQTLWADAKAGEKDAVNILKHLNLLSHLEAPTTPAPVAPAPVKA